MPLKIDSIKSPDNIDCDILAKILNEQVSEFHLSPVGKGVLSNVQTVEVKLSTKQTSQYYLVKFRKDEIPLEDLFRVEGTFYHFVDELKKQQLDAFPFRLSKALATGTHCIVLEYISSENVTSLDVHQLCPVDQFDDMIQRMAKMHAYFWMNSSQTLTTTTRILNKYANILADAPGAGQTLPSSTRQEQFEAAWPAVRKRLVPFFSSESLYRLDNVVKWIASCDRIEMIKRRVDEKKYTLVHGDFHMGNLLLPKISENDDVEEERDIRPWLVDWSFSGIGNPLVDLVFFLAMNDVVTRNIDQVLQNYYSVLKERSQLSWNDFLTMFRQCLLNQFVILVCYDNVCREMADSSPNEMVEVQHTHFDRVNTRCTRMILASNFESGKILQI